jgi:hypothetical protein
MGSDAVTRGKLRGTTDTDWFYFFCPKCPGDRVLRILDYSLNKEVGDLAYTTLSPKAVQNFILVLNIYCPECGLMDSLTISNVGRQGGTLQDGTRCAE